MNKLSIEASINNLDAVIDFINSELDSYECPIKTRTRLDIAVEEIFVNIAHYAYSGETGMAEIIIDIKSDPTAAVITFIDSGVPYDPLAKEDPDVTLSLEQRKIGGLGIFMVKKSMDDMIYEYKDGKNHLTIVKNL